MANLIKELRTKAGLTQEELASIVGIKQNSLSQIENGKGASYEILSKIAKALGVSVDVLMGKTPYPSTSQPKRDYDLVQIPIVSREHTACCGGGIAALDITSDPEETILIPRKMLGRIDDLRPPYGERTNGSSMTTYGIAAGSIVAINPGEEVTSGDVALVCLGDDEAIKAVIFKPDSIELHSDRQTMTVSMEEYKSGWFRIIGKIVAIVSVPKHGI